MRKLFAIAAVLALLTLPAAGVAAATGDQAQAMKPVSANANCTYFKETQHNLCAGFLRYWQTYGGLAVYGFPITEEFVENGMTVQYFERARFEWHPGQWPERWDVMLGLLGNWYAQSHDLLGTAPFQKVASCSAASTSGLSSAFLAANTACWFYGPTGHTLTGAFATYWQNNGGLAVFGYPVSQAFVQNGMVVQYFERNRFEWHPEFAGTPSAVELGLLGNRYLLGANVTTLASGLDNPRQLISAYDSSNGTSTVWVANAGKAGSNCIGSGDQQVCAGDTGSILQIQGGHDVTVVGSLASGGNVEGISGPSSLAAGPSGSVYYVIQGPGTPDDATALGSMATPFGKVYKYDPATGKSTVVADLAAYEYANNPDAANPLPEGADAHDSDPYGIYNAGSYLLAVDAAGNDLLKIDANGNISVVAIFPLVTMDAPPFLNLPPGTQIPTQAVPTSVVVGPDGNYYVSELTGFPFQAGKASIYKVTPDGKISVYASGLTNVMQIAFDSTGHLFAVEMVQHGLLAAGQPPDYQANQGAVIRINWDGSQTVIANVPAPGGIAVGPDDTLYVSSFTDSGTSSKGQVLAIDY